MTSGTHGHVRSHFHNVLGSSPFGHNGTPGREISRMAGLASQGYAKGVRALSRRVLVSKDLMVIWIKSLARGPDGTNLALMRFESFKSFGRSM